MRSERTSFVKAGAAKSHDLVFSHSTGNALYLGHGPLDTTIPRVDFIHRYGIPHKAVPALSPISDRTVYQDLLTNDVYTFAVTDVPDRNEFTFCPQPADVTVVADYDVFRQRVGFVATPGAPHVYKYTNNVPGHTDNMGEEHVSISYGQSAYYIWMGDAAFGAQHTYTNPTDPGGSAGWLFTMTDPIDSYLTIVTPNPMKQEPTVVATKIAAGVSSIEYSFAGAATSDRALSGAANDAITFTVPVESMAASDFINAEMELIVRYTNYIDRAWFILVDKDGHDILPKDHCVEAYGMSRYSADGIGWNEGKDFFINDHFGWPIVYPSYHSNDILSPPASEWYMPTSIRFSISRVPAFTRTIIQYHLVCWTYSGNAFLCEYVFEYDVDPATIAGLKVAFWAQNRIGVEVAVDGEVTFVRTI